LFAKRLAARDGFGVGSCAAAARLRVFCPSAKGRADDVVRGRDVEFAEQELGCPWSVLHVDYAEGGGLGLLGTRMTGLGLVEGA
jgi:hypothetical protein